MPLFGASIRGLMLAGYAATTVTLGWLADLLVHQPDVLAALEESIERGEDGYLAAVVAESLRLRPALPLTGRSAHCGPSNLNGLLVPPGVFIVIAIMALHERTDLHPDPRLSGPSAF